MNSKQCIFFATRADVIKMMAIVEERVSIEYVPMGAFDNETIKREESISKFFELGYTSYGSWISLDNRYMVIPLNEKINYRTVRQKDGSYHYITDPSSNPTGVELSTGGIYKNAENVLIAERIAVFTDSSNKSEQIYKEIGNAMKKCYSKKGNVYVSQEALSLLKDGWHLGYTSTSLNFLHL